MTIRYLTLLLILSIYGIHEVFAQSANQKPNIILIMADDMGYECLSSNGSLSYSTPELDKLAANGIRFTQCHSQPLCTPSRVKIMTGRYN
ncbi:MAG: sulfatase-like hydrolase/transferase, partial [Cyclobacteriaceae bacterium]|nr:sulfatase-like hydrolase/transferase [Cyclobacteriaceae bacterium]